MSERINAGDRVRFTIEGRWGSDLSGYSILEGELTGFDRPESITIEPGDVVSIEKVEAPAEVFRPGTVVRSKMIPEFTYLVGVNGYLDLHNNGIWNADPQGNMPFTSEDFDLVEVNLS